VTVTFRKLRKRKNDVIVSIFGGPRNENDVTDTIFPIGIGNENDIIVSIFYLVSNENDVTVTFTFKMMRLRYATKHFLKCYDIL
jgi:hypothetical protein